MATIHLEYHSEVLDMEREIIVLYPDRNRVTNPDDTDIPVLYLLHGMGGNHHSWLKRTHLERLVRTTNLIVVMMSTDKGWYTNTAYGMRYYDAIAIELPQILKRFFPNISDKREKNFIAGYSMGGYGAFKIALTSNRFSYAASLSGALVLDFEQDMVKSLGDMTYWQGVFGDLSNPATNPNSLLNLASLSDKQTKLYAWCGTEDFLFEGHQKAVAALQQAGHDIVAKSGPGKHEWYYWAKELEHILKWLPIGFILEERME